MLLHLTTACKRRCVDLTAEFDSWYEESFLGGVSADRPPAQANVAAAGKPETLSKADTCVRYYFRVF